MNKRPDVADSSVLILLVPLVCRRGSRGFGSGGWFFGRPFTPGLPVNTFCIMVNSPNVNTVCITLFLIENQRGVLLRDFG